MVSSEAERIRHHREFLAVVRSAPSHDVRAGFESSVSFRADKSLERRARRVPPPIPRDCTPLSSPGPPNLQRIMRMGYALSAFSDTQNVPQKSCGRRWKPSDVPGTSKDAKAAEKPVFSRLLDVYGRLWTWVSDRNEAEADLNLSRVPGFMAWLVALSGRESLGNASVLRCLCALEPPGYLSSCYVIRHDSHF